MYKNTTPKTAEFSRLSPLLRFTALKRCFFNKNMKSMIRALFCAGTCAREIVVAGGGQCGREP
jgi:hypothetical protein